MRLLLVGPPSPVATRIERDLLDHAVVDHVERVEDPDEISAKNDLVVSVLSGQAEVEHASNAIKTGLRYVACSFTPELAQHLEGVAGPGSVVMSGWSPGLTSVLAMKAAAQVTEATGLRISWVNSASGSEAQIALRATSDALSASAVIFDGGRWRRELSGSSPESVYFPPPIGWRPVSLAASAEASLLPDRTETLKGVRVLGGNAEPGARLRRLGMLRDHAAMGWSSVRADAFNDSGQIATIGVLDRWMNMMTATVTATVQKLSAKDDIPKGLCLPTDLIAVPEMIEALRTKGLVAATLLR